MALDQPPAHRGPCHLAFAFFLHSNGGKNIASGLGGNEATLIKLLFGGPFHQCLSEAVALRGAARRMLLRGPGRVGARRGAGTGCEGVLNAGFRRF
jgi:hypothetical protein